MYSNYSDIELNAYNLKNIGVLYKIIKDIRNKENAIKFSLIDYELLIKAEPYKTVGKEQVLDREKIKENIKKAKELRNYYLDISDLEKEKKQSPFLSMIQAKNNDKNIEIKQVSSKEFKKLIKKQKQNNINI